MASDSEAGRWKTGAARTARADTQWRLPLHHLHGPGPRRRGSRDRCRAGPAVKAGGGAWAAGFPSEVMAGPAPGGRLPGGKAKA